MHIRKMEITLIKYVGPNYRITPTHTLLHIPKHEVTPVFQKQRYVCVRSGVCVYLSVLGVTPVTSQAEWSSVVNQLPNPSISITAAPEQRSRVKRTS